MVALWTATPREQGWYFYTKDLSSWQQAKPVEIHQNLDRLLCGLTEVALIQGWWYGPVTIRVPKTLVELEEQA